MEFDLENPLTNSPHNNHSSSYTLDTASSLFLIESQHMPSHNYLHSLRATDFDACVRREAVSSILQCSYQCLDPSLTYLAVNYLDRFLSSSQEMPQPKPWVLRLIAVSCVSLASKMRKTETSVSDFQGHGRFVFDPHTVERMENVILGALKWRMRSITPFSFLSFFITLFDLQDPPSRQALKARATEIIFNAQNDVKFLKFKPSIVAAAALLSSSHELFPLQSPCFLKAISGCPHVNKENLAECCKAMQEREAVGEYGAVFDNASSADTPVNVLDLQFSGSESDKTITTIHAHKRRKISGWC